MNVEHLKGNI